MNASPVVAFVVFTLTISTRILAGDGPPASTPTPFVRFVPSSANVMISVSHLADVEEALQRAHAERVIPLFVGTQVQYLRGLTPALLVRAYAGSSIRLQPDDLRASQFVIAARSWKELFDGVLFVRPHSNRTVDRWFGEGQTARISPSAQILRVKDEIVACARDNIIAVSRKSGPDTLMRETLRLMAGRSTAAIAGTPAYRDLVRYLPAQPLAFAFFSQAESDTAEASGLRLKNAVVGLYDRDGRLDFAIRGVRNEPYSGMQVSDALIAQFRSLPATTLLAYSMTYDFEGALQPEGDAPSTTLARYLRLLMVPHDGDEGSSIPRLGPSVLLVWDENAESLSRTPEFAVLVETRDPHAVAKQVSRSVESVLDLLDAVDPVAPEATPSVSLWSHQETPIASVPLRRYAAASRFPSARLLENLSPSWASFGNWFVLATNREYVMRILDASAGRVPTLASHPDAESIVKSGGERQSIGFIRGARAAALIDRWLADAKRGEASLLNRQSLVPKTVTAGSTPEDLGIDFHAAQEPGEVIISEVRDDSPAAGRLFAGDRVVGVDGELLDLPSPNEDLKRRLTAGAAKLRQLRVRRGDTLVDVELTTQPKKVALPALPVDAADALRELALMIRNVDVASFSELKTGADQYGAMLSVRFVADDKIIAESTDQAQR